MEESKSKVVEMSAQTEKDEKSQKMSYEQLEQVAHQLSEQTRQLYSQLQKANLTNMFRRLDYLFKVLENNNMFKQDFIDKCTAEIEDIMTVPEEPADSEKDSKESTTKN